MILKKKKSLGQHFLNNRHYLGLVADAAHIQKGDTVVEIGPGEGTLTVELLATRCKVLAIEKDRRLIPLLEEKFVEEIKGGTLKIIEGDALDFNPRSYKLEARSYKVVGNIPYYITGALLKKFLSEKNQPSVLVFLMQKEVAQRITSHPSTGSGSQKESILSLSVKAYGDVKYVKTVPRGAFNPPPKVDSAILAVDTISRSKFTNAAHEKNFFDLVKKGFASKRKMLASNLGHEYSNNLQNVGVSLKARAEDVPLAQWLELAKR